MSLPKSWKSFVTGLTRRTSTSVSPDLATVLPLASHRRSVISPSSFAAARLKRIFCLTSTDLPSAPTFRLEVTPPMSLSPRLHSIRTEYSHAGGLTPAAAPFTESAAEFRLTPSTFATRRPELASLCSILISRALTTAGLTRLTARLPPLVPAAGFFFFFCPGVSPLRSISAAAFGTSTATRSS